MQRDLWQRRMPYGMRLTHSTQRIRREMRSQQKKISKIMGIRIGVEQRTRATDQPGCGTRAPDHLLCANGAHIARRPQDHDPATGDKPASEMSAGRHALGAGSMAGLLPNVG